MHRADVGNERWKGMTWGMMPLLGGALSACTYHFFYNSPDLDFLVVLQVSPSLHPRQDSSFCRGPVHTHPDFLTSEPATALLLSSHSFPAPSFQLVMLP